MRLKRLIFNGIIKIVFRCVITIDLSPKFSDASMIAQVEPYQQHSVQCWLECVLSIQTLSCWRLLMRMRQLEDHRDQLACRSILL